MKKAIGGVVIICVLLVAFIFARPFLFGEDAEAGNQVAESLEQSTEEPDVESVIASAINPTNSPTENAEGLGAVVENRTERTEIPTVEPTSEPTVVPTAEPTATPQVVEIPEPTKVPAPAVTETPRPAETQEPEEEEASVSDADITYVAELLDVPEEKVREVISRAEEEGYELNADTIMSGEIDVMEMWDIVTDVFGTTEATKLLLKVMKLGVL